MRRILATLAAVTAIALAAPAAEAQMTGGMMNARYNFPCLGCPYADYGTTTVGAGVEFTAGHDGLGTIDVDNYWFDITWPGCGPGCSYTPGAFNGIVLSDIGNTMGAFTSVTLGAQTQNLTQSMISWDAENIYINWQGMSINENAVARIHVNQDPGVVPEPATVTLMATGLVGVIGAAVRRRRKV